MHCLGSLFRAVASGGAGGTEAPPPPVFGRSFNLISTRGAHYPHPQLPAPPPEFSDLATPLLLYRFLQALTTLIMHALFIYLGMVITYYDEVGLLIQNSMHHKGVYSTYFESGG